MKLSLIDELKLFEIANNVHISSAYRGGKRAECFQLSMSVPVVAIVFHRRSSGEK
jgi:hypothetical protein